MRTCRCCLLSAIFTLVSFSPFWADAQSLEAISLSGGFGFMVPHRQELRGLVQGHAREFGVGALFSTLGAKKEKSWHRHYGFPNYGFEFYYADLGNRAELGQQMALNAFLHLPFPFLKQSPTDRWQIYSHWGIGAGYTDVVWSLDDNLKGIALSSAFNVCLTAGFYASHHFSNRFSANAGVRMTHLSNGAVKLPNLGTNNLTGNIGLRYHLIDQRVSAPSTDSPDGSDSDSFDLSKQKKMHFFATVNSGIKENLPPGGPKLFVHNAAIGLELRSSPKSGFLLRSDLWYNLAVSGLIERNEGIAPTRGDRVQGGLALGYIRHFGMARFETQMGAYLYSRYRGNGLFYHRFVISHEITEAIRVTLGLKTHWARADHPELGVVFRW